MVILVVFKVFLVVKNLEILIQIVPDVFIYPYSHPYKRAISALGFKGSVHNVTYFRDIHITDATLVRPVYCMSFFTSFLK